MTNNYEILCIMNKFFTKNYNDKSYYIQRKALYNSLMLIFCIFISQLILINIFLIEKQSSENPVFFIAIFFILIINLYLTYKGKMGQLIILYEIVVFSSIFTYFSRVEINHEIIVVSMIVFISIFWNFISYKKWHLLLHIFNTFIIIGIRVNNFHGAYKNDLISEDTLILLLNSYLYTIISFIFIIAIFYIMERELKYSSSEIEKQRKNSSMYQEILSLLENDNPNYNKSSYDLEAYFDSLTKCLNRLAYHKFFLPSAFIKYSKSDFYLTFIDLNKLKYVNDNYGHAEGDRYIKTFVDLILLEIDQKQGFFRIGGDEFILINSGIEKSELIHKLNNANLKLKETFAFKVGFSYGIAAKSEFINPCMNLIEELADKRMYQMKESLK